MSEGPTAAGAARRVGSGTTRLVRAWKALPNESRLAAYASGALFLTLFLPWYQVTLIAPARAAKLQSASAAITGWGAFSFVEAAVLLVAVGVLTLLFQRAEGRAFHLPGGDGGVILAAGLWTCVLIVWRIFDKQGATTSGPSATTSGIEWGIFVALGAAAFLAYAGSRIRAAHRPEPPLPGEDRSPAGSSAAAMTTAEAATATARAAKAATATAAATTTPGEAAPRRPRSVPSEDRRSVPPRRRPRSASSARTAPPPYMAPRAGADPPPRATGSGRASTRRSADARPDWNADASTRRSADARPDWNADATPGRSADARPNADATPTPEAAPQPSAERPRRRPSAAELFERVVPDDPPTMPFGRAKPADVEATLRMAATRPPHEPAEPTPSDDQPTMTLGHDDDTLPIDRDR